MGVFAKRPRSPADIDIGPHQQGAAFLDLAGSGVITIEILIVLSQANSDYLILQSQKFERLGSNKTIQADVRVIAATNEDLEVAVQEKRFRADLYYRLNVFPIHVPSLRQRKDDLPVLVDHFVRMFSERHGRNVAGISTLAYRMLLAHNWPGNIRELENVIERAVIICRRGEMLDVAHFPQSQLIEASNGLLQLDRMGNLARVADDQGNMPAALLEMLGNGESLDLAGLQRMAIEAALTVSNRNVARAAKLLGVTRAQIDYRLKKWQSE